MGHILGEIDSDLHDSSGVHLSTPPLPTDERGLADYKRRLSDHLDKHMATPKKVSEGMRAAALIKAGWQRTGDVVSEGAEGADQRFWTMAVDAATEPASLVGIADEQAGGFIAYACGPEHAAHILSLLRAEAASGS